MSIRRSSSFVSGRHADDMQTPPDCYRGNSGWRQCGWPTRAHPAPHKRAREVATGPENAKPRVTCASPAACSLGSVVCLVALPGGGLLLVVTSTRPDLLGDQPGAATDAAAVLTT